MDIDIIKQTKNQLAENPDLANTLSVVLIVLFIAFALFGLWRLIKGDHKSALLILFSSVFATCITVIVLF